MADRLDMIYDQVVDNRDAIRDVDSKVTNHMVEMEGRVTTVEERVSLRTRLIVGGAGIVSAVVAALKFFG